MIAEHAPKTFARAEPQVSRAPDRAERQAVDVARRVAASPAPSVRDPAPFARGARPLPESLRALMESQLGADLSDVRVHTDESAATASRALNAAAFTRGRDVHFAHGRFRPDRAEGRELIAHELTHVLQQRGTPGSRVGALEPVAAGTVQRAAKGPEPADDRTFRTRGGEVVTLPADMTRAEAERLETEGLAAEKKLATRPAPKPLPAIPKAAPPPRAKAKAPARPARARKPHVPAPAPSSKALAAELQASAGTSEVARDLAQRGMRALVRGVQNVHQLKRNQQKHADAETKRAESVQAVVIPPSDLQSRSNSAQVEVPRVAPTVDPNVAKQSLQASLRENMPKTLGAVDEFQREQRAQRMSAEVDQKIQADKSGVVAAFGELRATPPPAENDQERHDLPGEEVAPATPAIALGRDLVVPLAKAHTDLDSHARKADEQLKAEGVSQEQLDMVDSGDLAEARKEKKQIETDAATQPQALRDFAGEQAAEVETTLAADAAQERGAMRATRKRELGRTSKRQGDAKAALEKKREDVAAEINRRYAKVQSGVERRLSDLEKSAIETFEKGNAAAAARFEQDVQRELAVYKSDRYSGFFGRLRKAKDWLLGMEDLPRVKQIIESNRSIFVTTIDALVESISATNKRVVAECRDELNTERAEIKKFVDGLEPALQGIGKETAGAIGERLDALDKAIDQREQALQQQLKDKQKAAIQAIDEKITKLKESMSGAVAKLGRLLLWAAKKFFTWALKQAGYALSDIESIISKGVAVLKAIFTAPIRFVKNLIRAAKEGFASFGANFLKHLKEALFEWLTGSLEGIRLPEKWDARGLFGLALQILNFSLDTLVAKFKSKLLAKLGAKATAIAEYAERAFPLIKKVIVEGPAAAWEDIKSEAAEMATSLVDQLRNFVLVEIAKKAIAYVATLFAPGAGIVKAILGIYDSIVFFVQKARDIARMVSDFLGSMGQIAEGNVQAAAEALEGGLARALKLVIVFLAKLLKLDGIPRKIAAVVEKVRKQVDKVVDRVIDWVIGQAMKLLKAVKAGATKVVQAVTRWWAARKSFQAEDGKTHTLLFVGEESSAVLTVQSTPMPFTKFVESATGGSVRRDAAKSKALALARQIDALRKSGPTIADPVKAEEARKQKASAVDALLVDLVPLTSLLFGSDLPVCFAGAVNKGSSPFGTHMSIVPLTKLKQPVGQSPTQSGNPTYAALDARRHTPGGGNFYIRGHLLNQKLGGPGGWENLVPLSLSGNAQHERRAESIVKHSVDGAAVVEYVVVPKLARRGDKSALLQRIDSSTDPEDAKRQKRDIVKAEDHVPVALQVTAHLLAPDLKKLSRLLDESISNPVPREYESYYLSTTPRPVPVDLSADGPEKLATIRGIGPVLAARIVQRRKANGKPWSTYQQIADEVAGIKAETLQTLHDGNHIRLFTRPGAK